MQQNRFKLALGLVSGVVVASAAFFYFIQASADTVADPAGLQAATAAVAGQSTAQMPTFNGHRGIVAEVLDAPGYTYVRLETAQGSYWSAAPTFAVEVGEELLVPVGMAMNGYTSTTLERTFEQLDFVGGFLRPDDLQVASAAPASMPVGHPAIPEAEVVAVEPLEGGLTVAGVFSSRLDLAGQEIELRGRVVKVNRQIMGTNWLHLQDGTGEAGTNDLVVTTQGMAAVGDVVVIKGKLAVDKDFGAGYSYEAIVEDAQVRAE
jgi:hypothetical protein